MNKKKQPKGRANKWSREAKENWKMKMNEPIKIVMATSADIERLKKNGSLTW